MDLAVGISHPRIVALQNAGLEVPDGIVVRALVDTGASCTCIDPSVLQQLNLTPTGKALVHTPSTGTKPVEQDIYDVGLILIHPKLSLTIGTLAVMASPLEVQGIHALIGRDILAKCLLVYDGQTELFTLAF